MNFFFSPLSEVTKESGQKIYKKLILKDLDS